MRESSSHPASAADPNLPAAQPLDAAALERLRRLGGVTLIGRMIDLFLENSVLRMESARTGLAGGDLSAVARAVHSLKSSAANLGALHLHRLAEDIEIRAEAADAEGVAELFPELESAFVSTRSLLTHEKDALQA